MTQDAGDRDLLHPDSIEISAREVARILEAGDPLQIMDVRAPERVAQGRIDLLPPRHFHNVRGSQLSQCTDVAGTGLDPDLPVAVICGQGSDSKILAHLLERSQIVPGELDTVFAFFKDPFNLEEITPPWLAFRISYVSDREVREGSRIEYQLKWQGVPMRWSTLISEYEENVRFADTMTRGPYRRWHHVHTFEAVSGGVLMRDRVEYELPLGLLGDLVHALVVRRQLKGIFDYRRRRIEALFSD